MLTTVLLIQQYLLLPECWQSTSSICPLVWEPYQQRWPSVLAAHWFNGAFRHSHASAPFWVKSRRKLSSRFKRELCLPSKIRAKITGLCPSRYTVTLLCLKTCSELSWPVSLSSQTLCQRTAVNFVFVFFFFFNSDSLFFFPLKKKKMSYSIMPYMCLTILWLLCLCWSHVEMSVCGDGASNGFCG